MSDVDVKHNELVRNSYSQRANSYNESHGGWHITLGEDFVSWLEPDPGETALDLACGTGLVTLPLAQRLGIKGKVVAVDLTPEMIRVGEERLASLQSLSNVQRIAPVTWVAADITSQDLLSNSAVQDVLQAQGGFDIISVCSALVLSPDQQAALRFWTEKLLKKGGRIIVDVPTEEITLHFLMTYHLPVALGLSDELSRGRLWIKGRESLAAAFEEIGLRVEQNITTKSNLGTTWYNSNPGTGLEVLQNQIDNNYPNIALNGKMDEAREVWPELWQKAARSREDGREGVADAHRLYVCIGRKL